MNRSLFRHLTLLSIATVLYNFAHAQNPVYKAHVKPWTAQIKILAISSSVRQSFGGNQDKYVAELLDHRGQPEGLVILVDRYPDYEDPIRPALIRSGQRFRMRLSRDENCDERPQSVHPFSVLAATDAVDLPAKLSRLSTDSLACFVVSHTATRLSK